MHPKQGNPSRIQAQGVAKTQRHTTHEKCPTSLSEALKEEVTPPRQRPGEDENKPQKNANASDQEKMRMRTSLKTTQKHSPSVTSLARSPWNDGVGGYCEPQINQSQWASLAEVLSQMSCRTLPKGSRSSTKLCRNRPVHAMVRPCPHKKYATQNLQPGSSPGRLRGAPPSAGDISVQTFSKKYSFRKSCFRTGPLPKRNSGKHSRRCASRVPSNSFIHSCMSCLK